MKIRHGATGHSSLGFAGYGPDVGNTLCVDEIVYDFGGLHYHRRGIRGRGDGLSFDPTRNDGHLALGARDYPGVSFIRAQCGDDSSMCAGPSASPTHAGWRGVLAESAFGLAGTGSIQAERLTAFRKWQRLG